LRGVRVGFTSMNTPDELPPDVLARELEARGYESLWIGEHSHIPVERRTPYPAGGELPDPYLRMMDPYLSLVLAASATTRLVVGTGVALPLEHDLLTLAKTVATLDRLSGGRFEFGVGVGWNEEELANHRPIPWRRRYRALAECVAALRVLWSEDEAEFHGEFFDFDPVWSFPKPLQTPHPPVLGGMAGRLGTEHAVEWADGWMPTDVGLGVGGTDGIERMAKKLQRFRDAVAETGRAPVPVTMYAWGDPSIALLDSYRDLGIERVILGAARDGWGEAATTLPFLDHYAAHLAGWQ
jgi:probable F420-dependent oxidoreductase